MLIVLGVAAGASLAVLVFERVRQRDPESASASMRRVHQLAAVIVVFTSAIEKIFDALQVGVRSRPIYGSSYGSRSGWSFDEDEDQR